MASTSNTFVGAIRCSTGLQIPREGGAGAGFTRRARRIGQGKAFACLVAAAAAIAGCATAPVAPRLPREHVQTVGPFEVVSNRPFAQDTQLFAELERLEDDVQTALPPGDRPRDAAAGALRPAAVDEALRATPRIVVYLFDDPQVYQAYIRATFPRLPRRRAYFVRTGNEMTVYTSWTDRVIEDLRHELTHALVQADTPGVPLWLDEGLAEFFEAPQGWNVPHARALAADLQRGWRPDLFRLEKLEDVADMQQEDYREAWAWVHLLLSGKDGRALLLSYFDELRNTGKAMPFTLRVAAAWPEYNEMLLDHLREQIDKAGLNGGS